MLAFAVLSLVPAVVSFVDGQPTPGWRCVQSSVLLGLLGAWAARLRCTDEVQTNEAMVVSVLAFLLPSIFMAWPTAAYGISGVDAFFECVSGITTTGLSTLTRVEGRPESFLFLRAWIQWLGGLGVVVLSLAWLIPSSVASVRFGFGEEEARDFVGSSHANARRVTFVYLFLTLLGWLTCWGTGLQPLRALHYAMSAISTGGFAPSDSSLAELSPASRSGVLFVSLLGGLSFFWYLRLAAGPAKAFRDSQLWTLLLLAATGTVALAPGVAACGYRGGAGWAQAAWMSVSAQSTAGFETLDTSALGAFSKLVLVIQMAIGGHVGSTSGGLKVLRLLLLVRVLEARVMGASVPSNSELPQRLDGLVVQRSETDGATALALIFVATVLGSWFAFLAVGYDPLDSLFEVVSSVGTAGLSAGVVGPDLEPSLKAVLAFCMLAGRVELLAVLIFLFPPTWFGRRKRTS